MKQKIAIYGLGHETQKNIERLVEQYDVIGLLDSFQNEGELYALPIISIEEAVKKGVKRIVVIARPGSCKAIVEKIRKDCESNVIEVVDLKGNNLLSKVEIKYGFSGMEGYKKAELIQLTDKADVISFDLFDTLVMRRILTYDGFIGILAYRVSEEGIQIEDFAQRRLKAEIELSREKVPFLREIYEYMLPDSSRKIIDKLVETEYRYDMDLLVPRKEMVSMVNDMAASEKKVYITTDTYYSENQIRGILDMIGIDKRVDVMASCELGTTKSQNLFKYLKDENIGNGIVHIGDDKQSDYTSALNCGIKAFHIYNCQEIFDRLGGMGLTSNSQSLGDKIKIGILIANLFNSPFVFEDNGFSLKSPWEIGFALYAPMVVDFVLWIRKYVAKHKIKNVLFSARDGYLLQKMYSVFCPAEKTYYFLTSRIAALRACVENKEDIEYIELTQFSGTFSEKMKVRYGIDVSEGDIYENDKNCSEGAIRYKDLILSNAKVKRTFYLKYIDGLSLDDESKAFVDFSARGTIQKYCERLLGERVQGLYFLQLEPEFAKNNNIDIEPFYVDDNSDDNVIMDDFYIMEPVFSSPDASLNEFDEEGRPIWGVEDRLSDEIEVMKQIQDGILEYTKTYHDICPRGVMEVNKKLDEEIFDLIHKISISSKEFFMLRNIDPFVNRITDITVGV